LPIAGGSGTILLMTAKESVLEALHRLPDDADYKDIVEEVAFLAALREAEKDIENGRTVSHEEVRKSLDQWTSS
jgi:predicted transcriptional regulator